MKKIWQKQNGNNGTKLIMTYKKEKLRRNVNHDENNETYHEVQRKEYVSGSSNQRVDRGI